MANMVSNNSTNNNNNNNNSAETNESMYKNMLGNGEDSGSVKINSNSVIHNLRDVCSFLQPPINPSSTFTSNTSSYDHIIQMIRGLEITDDGIVMNHKIKSIETDFCNIVRDENMLCESMEYINDKALADGEIALKFALLFSSRSFDALAMKETKVRSAMLKILETNFLNADVYRVDDKNRLYNSITLLGEYYHRVRLADNTPITILGESLLGLLLKEINELDVINVKLAKLILSQITLNGDLMRGKHQADITQLLFHIRRNLIEQPGLKASVKALLLMTLDLYYSNFTNLGFQLEEMYTKYLVQDDNDDDEDSGFNNNNLNEQLPATPQLQLHDHNNRYENGVSDITNNDCAEVEPTPKKWSEQVCEDSLFESELGNTESLDGGLNTSSGRGDSGSPSTQDQLTNSNEMNSSSSNKYDSELDQHSTRNRRSYQQRSTPRPLKQSHNSIDKDDFNRHRNQSMEEERDQSKPLPRWRNTRFNRDNSSEKHQQQQRRLSGNCDDDKQSVRSDGGTIRLYTISDRLKHSQEKIARSVGGNNYNSIANSNWDRQSERDDRSERSYISNYERGNHNKRGARHYKNRQQYDKPPRFQKNQYQPNKDNKIYSDTWRRSSSHNSYQDENCSYRSNNSDNRDPARARTLPRPAKSNYTSSERRSHSPTQNQYQNQRPRNYNPRYSSQSSLTSETSNNVDRRHNQQQNRNFNRRSQHYQNQKQDWEDTRSLHGEPNANSANWNPKDDTNSELVRNARQTTNYMNYLSSKK